MRASTAAEPSADSRKKSMRTSAASPPGSGSPIVLRLEGQIEPSYVSVALPVLVEVQRLQRLVAGELRDDPVVERNLETARRGPTA